MREGHREQSWGVCVCVVVVVVVVGEMCFWLKKEHSDFSLHAATTAFQVCEIEEEEEGKSLKKTVKEHRDWWSVKEKREVWFECGMCSEGGVCSFEAKWSE